MVKQKHLKSYVPWNRSNQNDSWIFHDFVNEYIHIHIYIYILITYIYIFPTIFEEIAHANLPLTQITSQGRLPGHRWKRLQTRQIEALALSGFRFSATGTLRFHQTWLAGKWMKMDHSWMIFLAINPNFEWISNCHVWWPEGTWCQQVPTLRPTHDFDSWLWCLGHGPKPGPKQHQA